MTKHRSKLRRGQGRGRAATTGNGGRRSASNGVRAVSASEVRLLAALRETPRHRFCPGNAGKSVPDDLAIPLGRGRSIPPVDVVAMILRALELEGTERVLVVGGGSGYQAALLSHLAREVISVEMDDDLVKRASRALEELARDNVRVVHGDAAAGWPSEAPYDAIVVWVGISELPHALIDQLAVGGRLVIPLGDADGQLVERLHKRFDGLDAQTIGACRCDVLTNPNRTPSSFPWSSHRL